MLYYITGNTNKIAVAKKFLDVEHVEFNVKNLSLTEIQSESIVDIAKDKAEQAFLLVQQPLFVNDHGWSIPALKGFPGPFMKYMNSWLEADDFIKLMEGKENRDVFLTEVICYIDQSGIKTFTQLHKGTFLEKAEGVGLPFTTVTSLSDDRISVANKITESPNAVADETYTVWKEFADWFKNKK